MRRRVPLRGGIAVAIPTLSSLLLLSTLAGAQPPPPAGKAQPAAPPAAPAVAQPAKIEVDDPLLAAVPPAPHTLNNWKEALTMIMSRSIDLAIAVQEVQRAEGSARQALALALPTITATGTITGQLITPDKSGATTTPFTATIGGMKVSGSFDVAASPAATNPTVTGSIIATQPILAPRAWYGIRTAEMGVASARFTVEDKKRTVFAGVANSIVTVFTTERVAELNRTGLRSALERLDLTRRQFKLGNGTRLDVLRAEQDAATARATLVSGDESLRQAREALGLALGFNDAYGVPPSIKLDDIEQTVRQVCAPGPLDDRADIKQARNDIEIAKRGITDAWLAFSPTAALSSTASITNSSPTPSGHPGSWNIQALLTIPLWEGGARYGAIRIAKANAEESKLKLEAALRGATIGVAQAVRSVIVAEQSRQVSESTRDLAREAARLAQRAYEVGTGTSFDLVDTAQKQRAAELDLAVKEFQVIQAKLSALLAASNCTY